MGACTVRKRKHFTFHVWSADTQYARTMMCMYIANTYQRKLLCILEIEKRLVCLCVINIAKNSSFKRANRESVLSESYELAEAK